MTLQNTPDLAPIEAAVAAYRVGDMRACVAHYQLAIRRYPELAPVIQATLDATRRLHRSALIPSGTGGGDGRVSSQTESIAPVLRSMGIERIYVVNLDRRPDRMARVLREMIAQGLEVTRMPAVDARSSARAGRLMEEFRRGDVETQLASASHVSRQHLGQWKTSLTPGVFGYLLSQEAVLRDAARNGYRRILVFDDDVFFTSDAVARLREAAGHLPEDWKILLLGASEYADRSSHEFVQARVPGCADLYHPIAGKTCGSFAVAYDQSMYDEMLRSIAKAEAPYDNFALGCAFSRHPTHCFTVDPAVCVPDVSESNIRDGSRAQQSHSRRMRWEFRRYEAFIAPMKVAVLVDDLASLRYVENLQHRLPGNLFLNIYYCSRDGLRPVIAGRCFAPADKHVLGIAATDGPSLRRAADALRVPDADIVMLWPFHRQLDDGAVQTILAGALERANRGDGEEGTIGGVVYCLNAGVVPVPGLHSIVIPCFRGVSHAWPSILSALQQDARRFEVIVVNDNPTQQGFRDELMRLLAEHGSALRPDAVANLQVIEHQVNRNAAAARNTGFFCASGEFVSFLDDDDHFEPNRLSAVEGALSASGSNVGAVYCGYSGAWHGQKDESRFVEGNLGAQVLALRYGEHYMCTNTVTFRRTSFAALGGFNEAYRRHQDLELMARFFNEYQIVAVPEFCVRNRPSPVPETFTADIFGLCKLKHQFLRDFRIEIRQLGEGLIEKVLESHAEDISKRDRKMPDETLRVIKLFLRSALTS